MNFKLAILRVLIASFLFFVLFFLLYSLSQPSGVVLDRDWIFSYDNQSVDIELPFYDFPKASGLAMLKTTFRKTDANTLVIPKISCYALKVFINDQKTYEVGDFNNPTANLWNYAHVISFDDSILQEENDLTIKAYLLDDIGMHIPPFIDDYINVSSRISIVNFLNNDMYLILIGISIGVGLIFITFGIVNSSSKSLFIYLGIGAILASIFSLDSTFRISTGNLSAFLIIRKLLFFSVYLSMVFLVIGVEKYLDVESKFRWFLLSIIFIAECLVLSSSDFIELRRYINVLNVIMIIGPIYVIYLLIKQKHNILYITTTFSTIVMIYTVLSVFFKTHTPFLFPYSISVFAIGVCLALIIELTNVYKENVRLYEKSTIDYLTKAYNRHILDELEIEQNDVVILLDLDNFKAYNDTHGHCKGDILLKNFVEIIKANIEDEDYVIRYGGDEFLIIIKNIKIAKARLTIDRIRRDFKEKIDNSIMDISYGIIQNDADLVSCLRQADKKMYDMKFEKKHNSRITI